MASKGRAACVGTRRSWRTLGRALVGALVAGDLVRGFAVPAHADALLVNSDADAGPGSLRQALQDANEMPGHDTITFDPTFFATPRTIALNGELAVSDAVTISGPGAALLTLSGGGISRIFSLNGPGTLDVALSGMTLRDGVAARGGAIADDDEALLLTDVVIQGSSASDGGGAISVVGAAALTLDRCVIRSNRATGAQSVGGGIALQSAATVQIRESLISGNSATNRGGGIYFFNGGSLNLDRSTVVGNSAGGSGASSVGGGIYFFGVVGSEGFTITNSTFSGNNAPHGGGGGLVLRSLGGTATIAGSTIVSNSATGGGGIARSGGPGTLTLVSTIVAANNAPGSPDIASDGSLAANRSLIGRGDGLVLGDGNLVGTQANPLDPKLGPLQNNGGPTSTRSLLAGSPALDAGANPTGLSSDQRGAGFVRSAGAAPDIGAYEVQSAFVVTNSDDQGVGTLRQAVANANSNPGPDTISFDQGAFGTIELTSGQISITGPLTISGPGPDQLTLRGPGSQHGSGRLIEITSQGTPQITLAGLTLRGGGSANGGALSATNAAVTIANTVIADNGGAGGSVLIQGVSSSLVLDGSVVQHNQGGIVVATGGAVTLRRSSVANNQGSGIAFANGGTLLVEQSTISGNQSVQGGGIAFSGAGRIDIRSSTIDGNHATYSGGGVLLDGFSGSATIVCSTISDNSASVGGGGIAKLSPEGNVSLISSIVAANHSPIAPDALVNGPLAASFSLIGVADELQISGDGNQSGTQNAPLLPRLGLLQDNGGATFTRALLYGSPALDHGTDIGITTDQRGMARTYGPTADIGAFELQSLPDTPTPTPSSTPSSTALPAFTPSPTATPGVPTSRKVYLPLIERL